MSKPSWAQCLTGAALLAATVMPTLAAATVVTFESAPPLTLVGPGQPDASYTESGVSFTPSGGDARVGTSACTVGTDSCISNNLTTYLTALNGATVTITAQQAFSLIGFDASFFPPPTPKGLFAGTFVGLQLLGALSGGGTFQSTVQLFEDAFAAGDFVFANYATIAPFPLLSSLTLSACVFIGPNCLRSGAAFDAAGYHLSDLQFAIDNLSVSTVPEPSTHWLLALCLVGLAFTRRGAARPAG